MRHPHLFSRPIQRSFVVRIWRTITGRWRASLYDPQTDQRVMFANPQQLQDYLSDQMHDGASAPAPRLEICTSSDAH